MRLSPREIDKLVLHGAGFVSQKRYARGLRLNYPEAVALIASQLLEFIRDGGSVADLMDRGKRLLGTVDVLPGVPEMVGEVQVEGTFPDGTKLVTVHDPVCSERGDPRLALHGSGLERTASGPRSPDNSTGAAPGEVVPAAGEIEINSGRETVRLEVANLGDRPVQVGSHYPFFETNPQLSFDRGRAFGFRLDIPGGTAVRFEPGEVKTVDLVAIDGRRRVFGGNGLIDGEASEERREPALSRARERGFLCDEPAT